MTAFRAHTKQFLLGPSSVRIHPDWVAIELGSGLVLSVCPKLPVTRLQSRDGAVFHLLGLAVPADRPATTIAEIFPTKDASEVEDWTGFWAGKWVLIGDRCVWPDATTCIGIFHRRVGGAVWISSSPALLGEHLPEVPIAPYIAWHVRHRTGIDWIPLPLTTREEVYKMMPLRTIDPLTGVMRPVRFAAAETNDAAADDRALATAMTTIMGNWAKLDFQDHYVSLTAGLDTRLILAATIAAGHKLPTRTVTYPEASKADLAMPPRLAAAVGVPHKLIRRPDPPLALSDVLARSSAIVAHTDGVTFHPSSAAFANGLDDFMNDPRRTMTIGHCFALGRCYYWRRFGNAGLREAPPSADQLLDAFYTHSYDPHPFWSSHPRARWREAMQLWLDSLAEPRALKLDWRDAFQLDQFQGGWGSAIHRHLDINDGHYFLPGNCLWVFHLLMRDPVEKRAVAFAHRNAIRILSPALAQVPTNPPSPARRVKRVVKSLLGERGTQALKSQLRRLKLR